MSKQSVLEHLDAFPLMGEPLTPMNSVAIALEASNQEAAKAFAESTETACAYIDNYLAEKGKQYAYGGYLEDRSALYSRSPHFVNEKGEARCIHLGTDIWTSAGAPIYAPLDARIHSFANNEGFGNYGPTLILEHQNQGEPFFTLYGHLSLSDMQNWEVGKPIQKGELIAHLGAPEENIGWPPHLHFQIISDMKNYQGDFPGVCYPSEVGEFV